MSNSVDPLYEKLDDYTLKVNQDGKVLLDAIIKQRDKRMELGAAYQKTQEEASKLEDQAQKTRMLADDLLRETTDAAETLRSLCNRLQLTGTNITIVSQKSFGAIAEGRGAETERYIPLEPDLDFLSSRDKPRVPVESDDIPGPF